MNEIRIKPNMIPDGIAGGIFLGVVLVLSVMLMAGCAVPSKHAVYPVSSFNLPAFQDDMHFDGLEHSIRQSIDYLKRIPPEKEFQFGEDAYSAEHVLSSLEEFLDFFQQKPDEKELQRFIRSRYRVYRSVGGPEHSVLYTGYYEPFLKGRRQRDSLYSTPILARPENLLRIDLTPFSSKYNGESIIGRLTEARTVVPYYNREEIDADKVLEGSAPVLAWLSNPIDLFFLQIQGSGRVFLEDGDVLNVHYEISNGHPYRSIGRLLIDEGKIPRDEISMQSIRDYLTQNPDDINRVFNYNPSYVFFKTEEEGPLGFLEVKLTPGRSIALDRRLFPLPALAFIETEKPLVDAFGRILRWERFSRFVCSQDTGGAIRGPGRADLFWGNGTYAEIAAGHMQQEGNLYLLVLKPERQEN